jgi:ribosomal protein S18 acetylase RimI-like enzyme
MAQSVIIRDCTVSDFKDIFVLLKQLWPDKELHEDLLLQIFLEKMKSEKIWFLGAELEGKVVGFCSLEVKSSLWQEGWMAYINELIVHEKCRGNGIGAGLLNTAVEVAKKQYCKRIELDSALHRKAAHNLYKKLGFENRAHLFSKILQ